jgi:hypothetical protein
MALGGQLNDTKKGLAMESKAKLLGHSIHQMLIVFPLGLLATAVIFDVIHLLGGGPTMVAVAYWMMAAGIVGAGRCAVRDHRLACDSGWHTGETDRRTAWRWQPTRDLAVPQQLARSARRRDRTERTGAGPVIRGRGRVVAHRLAGRRARGKAGRRCLRRCECAGAKLAGRA